MKNELIRLNFKNLKLQHLKRKIMTITNIMYVVADMMKDHKGQGNAISSEDLFKKVYGSNRQPNYVDDFRWDYVIKSMHRLRQREKLFIIHYRHENGLMYWFVPTTHQESLIYIDQLENAITRQRAMQLKVVKSVNEKWYELDWIRESKMLSSYGKLIESKQLERKKAIADAKGLSSMSY